MAQVSTTERLAVGGAMCRARGSSRSSKCRSEGGGPSARKGNEAAEHLHGPGCGHSSGSCLGCRCAAARAGLVPQ